MLRHAGKNGVVSVVPYSGSMPQNALDALRSQTT